MRYFYFLIENNLIKVLLICIVLDTIFGVLRAIREKKTNSRNWNRPELLEKQV